MDYNLPGSSIHGIFQARVLEWVAMAFSRDHSNPGIEPRSPTWQVDSLPSESPGKPCHCRHILLLFEPLEKPTLEVQFSSVQSLGCVRLFVTPWTAAHQASLSITNSRSPLKLMSITSVMASNHLILVPFSSSLQSFPASESFPKI